MVAYTEGVGSLFLPIAATVTVFHTTVPTLDPQKKTPDPLDYVSYQNDDGPGEDRVFFVKQLRR